MEAEPLVGPALPPTATEEVYDPEEMKKAEEYKTKGNNFFKVHKYD